MATYPIRPHSDRDKREITHHQDQLIDRAPEIFVMATAIQTQIDSAAAAAPRKLPIKCKKTPQPSHDPLPPAKLSSSSSEPHLQPSFDDDDDDDEEDVDDAGTHASASVGAGVAPPYRFQRVWSESDEIRFLQGLLGCWSQGLVFPRDLNLFFDRFSESMPQPYTRSQLSEKLRRLRKKFRVMSTRIDRGQDPARLSPHDRDVLHLCTRLWHPSYAATSPFSDSLTPGSSGNKRRRPNPRVPSVQAPFSMPPLPTAPVPIETLPPPERLHPPRPPFDEKVGCATDSISVNELPLPSVKEENEGLVVEEIKEQMFREIKAEVELPLPATSGSDEAAAGKDVTRHLLAKTVLDVFDACLEELKVSLAESHSSSATNQDGMEKRWQDLRVREMDVLARRLRLVLEGSIKN